MQALYQDQAGPPLNFGNVIYPALEIANLTIQRWFNIDGFERRAAFHLD